MKNLIIVIMLALISGGAFAETLDVQSEIRKELQSAGSWKGDAWACLAVGSAGIAYGAFSLTTDAVALGSSGIVLSQNGVKAGVIGIGLGSSLIVLGAICGIVGESLEADALDKLVYPKP